jgi:hypothetical protein
MLSFNSGTNIARIRVKDSVYILKIRPEFQDDNNEEDLKDIEIKQNYSFVEKLMMLTKEELASAIKKNPNIKKRLQQELNNSKAPFKFKDGGREIDDIKGARFMFTFDPHKDREVIYMFGKSGSGKSILTRKYIKEYLLEFPDNDIFLFSLKNEDVAFDDFENLHRIPLEERVLKAVDLDTLKNSIVIFDDTESEHKEAWVKEITRIKDDIVQRGRSLRIFCIITTHMASNFNKTRVILNEADKIVSFPGRVSNSHFKYLFAKHCGVDNTNIKRMLQLRSRWVCFDRNYPMNVVHENGAFAIKQEE